MSGKIDGYIKHKDSFTIVDFKTTKINENKIDAYAITTKLCFNDGKAKRG